MEKVVSIIQMVIHIQEIIEAIKLMAWESILIQVALDMRVCGEMINNTEKEQKYFKMDHNTMACILTEKKKDKAFINGQMDQYIMAIG